MADETPKTGPAPSRYRQLRERLTNAGGRRLTRTRISGPDDYQYIELWLDPNNHPIVVHDMGDNGVDVYVQATGRNNMDELYKVLGI